MGIFADLPFGLRCELSRKRVENLPCDGLGPPRSSIAIRPAGHINLKKMFADFAVSLRIYEVKDKTRIMKRRTEDYETPK